MMFFVGARVRVAPCERFLVQRSAVSVHTGTGERVPLPAVGTITHVIFGAPSHLTQFEIRFDGARFSHVVAGEDGVEVLDVVSQLAGLA